jgi:hypothetical protein
VTISERFWAKVTRTAPNRPTLGPCWLWTASLDDKGYGQFYVGSRIDGSSRNVGAHRYAYEQEYGPIPPGLELDHLCRVRACVRPSHLEPVTSQENTRRGAAGAHHRVKTQCPAGHAYDVVNTYRDVRGRRHCRTCSREQERRRRAA